MCLQVDNEFQQVKIKDLNHENNVEMFTSTVCIRFRTKNSAINKKYGLSPNEIEKKKKTNLSSEKLKILLNFQRIKHTK